MKDWLTRGQFALMRVIGIRKLRESLDAKSDAVNTDIATRLDALRDTLAERDRATVERLDTLQRPLDELRASVADLRSEEGGRARSTYERGDALDLELGELQASLARLVAPGRGEDIERAPGDLRVEMSSLRVDFARAAEMMGDRVGRRASH